MEHKFNTVTEVCMMVAWRFCLIYQHYCWPSKIPKNPRKWFRLEFNSVPTFPLATQFF